MIPHCAAAAASIEGRRKGIERKAGKKEGRKKDGRPFMGLSDRLILLLRAEQRLLRYILCMYF